MRSINLSLATLALLIILQPVAVRADFADDFDVGELKVCPEGSNKCERVTCMDLCVSQGESPEDCPLYCNTFTQNQLMQIPKTLVGQK